MLEGVLESRGRDFFEVSVASDAASVGMRRYLKGKADTEARA